MIIQVRSCSGGGKTHAVRGLIEAADTKPLNITDDAGKTVGVQFYYADRNIAVLGKYDSVCGGCDTIKTADDICDRIKLFAGWADVVVFEGRIPSHTYQRYADLFDSMKLFGTRTHGTVIAYLDSTPEQCIKNIAARRAARGVDPLNWDTDRVRSKDFPAIENTRLKFIRDGFDVRTLRYEHSIEDLLEIVTDG